MAGSDYPRDEQPAPHDPAQGGFSQPPPPPESTGDYGWSAPPPPRRPNPPWLIWAIVGAATAMVLVVILVAINSFGNGDGGTGGGSAQSATPRSDTPSPQSSIAPVDELRSHLPPALRSASECQQTANGAYARAAIACEFSDSAMPAFMVYRLYADTELMNAESRETHSTPATVGTCESADDFTAGGETTWSRDGRDRGTVWCYTNEDGQPVLLWTEDTLHILAGASARGLDDVGLLLDWFVDAGPI